MNDIKKYSLFRPCIDLHGGQVKQIVGGSLNDQGDGLKTNFVSSKPASYYAELYRSHQLKGGHVILLGEGNQAAAEEALLAWPHGLQVGGGINAQNAEKWLFLGASHVIVTSFLFENHEFSWNKLNEIIGVIGKERLVIDLSCRRLVKEDGNVSWFVATNRWQTITQTEITVDLLDQLADCCAEFLIHAADVEGLQNGMDLELIEFLGKHVRIPCTYAGGASHLNDLEVVNRVSQGKVDLTIGSALDIFGGNKIKFSDCVHWNERGTV
jgi:phosphoribosylformimino-5-aminoimidazole carboxamide ribotide isomerase